MVNLQEENNNKNNKKPCHVSYPVLGCIYMGKFIARIQGILKGEVPLYH
jgi:hypothetical protein